MDNLEKTTTKNKQVILAVSIIVIAGFLLRLYCLGCQSLWYDEIYTGGQNTYSLLQTVRILFVSPFPPLYNIIMNIWIKIFSFSEFSLRFPSALFSALSIIYIFKLTKELFNEKAGLIAALLLSISPYSINYAQEAKMYSLLWFFGILSFYYFYRFIRDNKTRNLIWYIAATAICIYTMYIGFIFIIVQNIIFSFFYYKDKSRKWLLGQLAIIILYLPWLYFFIYNALHKIGIQWIPGGESYSVLLRDTFLLVTGLAIGRTNIGEICFYLLLIISALIPISKLTKNDAGLILWTTLPVVIYCLIDFLGYPIFIPRYAGFIHIPLIILISRGIAGHNVKTASLILIIFASIMVINHLLPYYKDGLKINGENWKELCRQLNQRPLDKALLLTTIGDDGLPYINRGIRYYGGREMKRLSDNRLDNYKGAHDAIVVIYRTQRPRLIVPRGYTLEESYFVASKGYKEDKNIREDIGFLYYKILR
jgi:uncharacterized membrane protein